MGRMKELYTALEEVERLSHVDTSRDPYMGYHTLPYPDDARHTCIEVYRHHSDRKFYWVFVDANDEPFGVEDGPYDTPEEAYSNSPAKITRHLR